tara:strand:+ start:698 stop:1066 length:369 start_codon:yes stop_codon:yes gene_type:complete
MWRKTMAIKTINATYWKQSTGLTGQNLTESNQKKFSRIAKKYKKVTETSLSKTRLYKASRNGARQVKKEFGARIGSTSIAMFEMLLTAIDKELKGAYNSIDFGEFQVKSHKDFANSITRKKA